LALWWLLACLLGTTDEDGDGFAPSDGDCDDFDAAVYPGADELCDGFDNDCDGQADGADAIDAATWYLDRDGDGFGGTPYLACSGPPGASATSEDCDDGQAGRYPGADELCNRVDEDCDDTIDEGLVTEGSTWADQDQDGYGDSEWPLSACQAGLVTADQDGDCDDQDPDVNPGVAEVCNDGLDNDCDGTANDCDPSGSRTLGEALARLLAQDEGDLLDGPTLPGAAVADVDGDGELDVLVGAPGRDEGGDNTGMAYLVHGPMSGDVSLSGASLRLQGEHGDADFGCSVAISPDLVGNGLPDLVIAARSSDLGGSNSGAVHVVPATDSGHVATPGTGATLYGGSYDHLGDGLATPGDLTGDGVADLVIGAITDSYAASEGGAWFLVPGPVTASRAVDDDAWRIYSADAGTRAGASVAVGDLSGDGVPDLLLGSHTDSEVASYSGAVWVVHGPVTADLNLAQADVKITGLVAQDQVGRCPAVAPDLDGDGLDDLVVDALGDDTTAQEAGAAYVFYQQALQMDLTHADAALLGAKADDNAGYCTAGAGDVNGDGDNDLLVSAKYSDDGGSQAGTVYLMLDRPTGTAVLADVAVIYNGESDADNAGHGLLGGFDVNHDGLADWLVSAPSAMGSEDDAGAVYIMVGSGL